jgi:hypothetical protein
VVTNLAICVYRSQQVEVENLQIDETLGFLRGIWDGMRPWGDLHFNQEYSHQQAVERAEKDRQSIREGVYQINYRVPTEPLENLIHYSASGVLLDRDVIIRANEALRRVGIFNQLVQQQTDFLAAHLPEVYDPTLDPVKRNALADTAGAISQIIHEAAIGDGAWYRDLMEAIEHTITALASRKRERFWNRRRSVQVRRVKRLAQQVGMRSVSER